MSTEILPCPFCGSRCASRGTSLAKWVYCTDDDVCGYVSAEGPAAIDAHNTVAAAVRDHAAVVARLAELEQAFDDIEGHRQTAALRVRKLEAELGRMRVALKCQEALDALREVAHLSDQWHAIIKPWRQRILDSQEAMDFFVGCPLYPGWEEEGLRRLAPVLRRAALAATAPKEAPDA